MRPFYNNDSKDENMTKSVERLRVQALCVVSEASMNDAISRGLKLASNLKEAANGSI